MSHPTLALCIPAYNAAAYLPRLLTSAAEQSVPFDEILVYDDCSTDDTAAVAAQYGATVVRGDVNRGCSTGKNRLAEATSCEWIHFHDADDDITKDFVERVRPRLTEAGALGVLLLHYKWIDYKSGEVLGEPRYDVDAMRRDPVAFVIRHLVPNFGIYKRDDFLAAGGFDLDPDVLYNEDAALHHRLALAGLVFDYEPATTCINYRYSGSMSQANGVKCARSQYHVMKKTAAHANERHHPLIADRLWAIAGGAGSFQDWKTADAAVRLAVRLAGRVPTPSAGSTSFRMAAAVSPRGALRLREGVVRTLRPHLRTS